MIRIFIAPIPLVADRLDRDRIGEVAPHCDVGDQQVVLDSEFIPSCMDCRSDETLSGYIKEIQGLLKHRAEAIAARVDADGKGGTPQVADFMLFALPILSPVYQHQIHALLAPLVSS